MRLTSSLALALALTVAGAAIASAAPSSSETAKKKRKRTKKKSSKKPTKKRTSHRSKRSQEPKSIPGVPDDTEPTPATDPGAPATAAAEPAPTDPATEPVATAPVIAPTDPATVDVDAASTPDVTADATRTLATPKPAASVTATATVTPTPRPSRHSTWYVGLRGGPSVVDRRGYYEYSSNRQIYKTERNVRLDLVFGRYVSRTVDLGLVLGTGPFPKFDGPDPSYDENTRFSVYPAHARLDVTMHAGPFVVGIGGGGAYEQAQSTFSTQDPFTFEVSMHTARFKRFGVVGAVHTGFQFQLGPLGLELLGEASAVKLMRGTYEHGASTPGPSDREMCYEASLLLGFRLQ